MNPKIKYINNIKITIKNKKTQNPLNIKGLKIFFLFKKLKKIEF
jgi:hypothetical protein